jgi:splicing factor 3B subunit 1
MILPSQGYEIVAAPEGYQPERGEDEQIPNGYSLPASESKPYEIPSSSIPASESDALPFIKPEEINYFSALLEEVDEDQLSGEEIRERRIMMLLLKVKNGTPPMRK